MTSSYAALKTTGGPTFLLPRNSDRRLPYAEWGIWSENISTLTGIELGLRAKDALISENRPGHRVP